MMSSNRWNSSRIVIHSRHTVAVMIVYIKDHTAVGSLQWSHGRKLNPWSRSTLGRKERRGTGGQEQTRFGIFPEQEASRYFCLGSLFFSRAAANLKCFISAPITMTEAGLRAISPVCEHAGTRSAWRLTAGERKSEQVKSERLTDMVEPQRGGQAGGGRVQQPSEHVQDALGGERHPVGDTLSTAKQGDGDQHWSAQQLCRCYIEILCSCCIYILSLCINTVYM